MYGGTCLLFLCIRCCCPTRASLHMLFVQQDPPRVSSHSFRFFSNPYHVTPHQQWRKYGHPSLLKTQPPSFSSFYFRLGSNVSNIPLPLDLLLYRDSERLDISNVNSDAYARDSAARQQRERKPSTIPLLLLLPSCHSSSLSPRGKRGGGWSSRAMYE